MTDPFQLPLLLEEPGPKDETPLALWTVEDLFAAASQSLLERLGEDRRLDRKSAKTQAAAIGDYAVMWSNTRPDGGLIVVGQENDGTFTGCSRLSQNQINILEKVETIYCPDVKLDTKRVAVVNSKGENDFVIIIRVHYHPSRLISNPKADIYVRKGDDKWRVKSEEEKRELRTGKGEIDYELEPSHAQWPGDFDRYLINEYCESFRKRRRLSSVHSVNEIMQLSHLGRIRDGRFVPNMACVLMFAADAVATELIPGLRLRFMRFDGTEEGTGTSLNLVRDEIVAGCVPHIIKSAEEIIEAQIRHFTRLGSGGKFYTLPEYPKEVWYEAVVNA